MYNKKQCPYLLRIFSAIFILGTLGGPSTLLADQATQYGCSPRGIAMGNAYTALAEDISGYHYNPAGPATLPRHAVAIGYLYNQPAVKLKGSNYNGPGTAYDEKSQFPNFGFSLDFQNMFNPMNKSIDNMEFIPAMLKPEMNMVMCMFGAMAHGGPMIMNTYTKWPNERHFPVIDTCPDVMFFAIGPSMQLYKKLFVGAGMNLAMTAYMTPSGHMTLQAANFPEGGYEYSRFGIDGELELAPIAGIMFLPTEKIRIGASWRKAYTSVYFWGQIAISANLPFDQSMMTPLMDISLADYYQPERWNGAVACQLTDKLLLALELDYVLWSGWNLPNYVKPAGGPFQDIFIPRIGAEYQLSEDLQGRLGYYYHPSPLKTTQTATRLMDAHQHVFSAGIGYLIRSVESFLAYPLELDLYVQYKYLPRRTIKAFDGTYSVSGSHLGLGFSLALQF